MCPQTEGGSGHCGLDGVPSTASSELLTLATPTASGEAQEVEGQPLQQHVVDNFHTDRQHTPEVQDQINQAPTLAAKVEIVYQRLRRVEIELIRNRTEQRRTTRTVPAGFAPVDCPSDVQQLAENCFRINDRITVPPLIPRSPSPIGPRRR